MPLLSVIIPTKNEQRHLPELLRNLAEQTFQDFEIIVADAGSTDQTRNIAQAAGARVVDGGVPGVGRNRGAQAAQGEVFVFLDADVVLPSYMFLADCLAEMRKQNIDVASCIVKPLSPRLVDRFFFWLYNAYVACVTPIHLHAQGSCIFATRSAHETLKGFDETVVIAEDTDYAQRTRRLGLVFRMLESFPVHVSVRRLDQYGRASFAWKYVYMELHLLVKGPIRRMPFEYDMGGGSSSSSIK